MAPPTRLFKVGDRVICKDILYTFTGTIRKSLPKHSLAECVQKDKSKDPNLWYDIELDDQGSELVCYHQSELRKSV